MSVYPTEASSPDLDKPWLQHALYRELASEQAKTAFIGLYEWSEWETGKKTYGPLETKSLGPPPDNAYVMKHAETMYDKPVGAVFLPPGCLYTYHDGYVQKKEGANADNTGPIRAKTLKAQTVVTLVLGNTKPPKEAVPAMEKLLEETKNRIKKVAEGKILMELRELAQQLSVTAKGKICTTRADLSQAWKEELSIELVKKMYKMYYYEWNCDKGSRFVKLQFAVMKDLGIWHCQKRDSVPNHSTVLSVLKEYFHDSWRKFLSKAPHGVHFRWSGKNKTCDVNWDLNVKNWDAANHRIWLQKQEGKKVNRIILGLHAL
jgi:hypothetical protein